ncbi:MAG: NAD(P)H-dependent oxidoreductase subunit E [Dehalogenimonas sp.]
METDLSNLEKLLEPFKGRPDMLIQSLLAIQKEYGWLPKKALLRVTEALGVPLNRVYHVATFYKVFSLKPHGRHHVMVCMGTACHVHGAPKILEKAADKIGAGPGETSDDMRFSLETVNCLGCCALGPVMVVDGEYHGKLPPADTEKVLEQYK